MNALQKLIRLTLKQRGLSRFQLVKMLGYHNVNKGLRVLDEFCAHLNFRNNISKQLPKILHIPDKIYQQAISLQLHKLEQPKREQFTPYVRILLSARPRPAISALLLNKIPIDNKFTHLPLQQQLAELFNRYVENQRQQFQSTLLFKRAGGDYFRFVDELEALEKQGKAVCWAFGKGYRYYRSYDESLSFDRRGKLKD